MKLGKAAVRLGRLLETFTGSKVSSLFLSLHENEFGPPRAADLSHDWLHLFCGNG